MLILFDLPLAFNAGLIYYNLGWAEALGEETVPLSLEGLRSVAKAMVFNA